MTAPLSAIHYSLTLLIMLLGVVATGVGAFRLVRWRTVGGNKNDIQRWLLIAAAALVGIEALLGLFLVLNGERPSDPRHYVWAFLSVGAIPFAFSYLRQWRFLRNAIVLTLAAVVIFIAAALALFTGCPYLGGCPH